MFASTLPSILLGISFLSLLAVMAAGPLHRFVDVPVGAALGLFAIAGLVGLVVAVIAAFYFLAKLFGAGPSAGQTFLTLAMSGGAAFLVLSFLMDARSVPAIHDITTDTANPPQFVAVEGLRGAGDHPITYDGNQYVSGTSGPTVREAQEAGYPGLEPLVVDTAPADVFAAALAEVEAQGWTLVEADEAAGRIEASDTTDWWGFTDDVVIRVASTGGGTRVDVRSKSRVGQSDLGANAERIEGFLSGLEARLR